jgi:cell wall assembly regulator SMI1
MSSSAWSRIDAWLATHAPKVLTRLRAPIDDAGLAKLEEAAGKPLPASVVDAYRAHDGAAGEHSTILGAVRAPKAALWARRMSWLSADKAVGSLRFMREQSPSWPSSLLPIADDGAGNLIVIDLETGVVSAWDHEDAATTRLADDLGTWMSELADDMDSRLVASGAAEDGADDELELLDAPPGPPRPPPVILPDRAARVFVEVLVEKKYAVLHKGANIEPLVAALTVALGIKSASSRKSTVIALLEESEAIDEIFVDDDKLEGLVDEIR